MLLNPKFLGDNPGFAEIFISSYNGFVLNLVSQLVAANCIEINAGHIVIHISDQRGAFVLSPSYRKTIKPESLQFSAVAGVTAEMAFTGFPIVERSKLVIERETDYSFNGINNVVTLDTIHNVNADIINKLSRIIIENYYIAMSAVYSEKYLIKNNDDVEQSFHAIPSSCFLIYPSSTSWDELRQWLETVPRRRRVRALLSYLNEYEPK